MSRRLVVLLVAGVALAGGLVPPAAAAVPAAPAADTGSPADRPAGSTAGSTAGTTASSRGERPALLLLHRAARTARTRAWHGTQHSAAWRRASGSTPEVTSAVVEVVHQPGRSSRIRLAGGTAVGALGAAQLTPRQVALLDRHFDLRTSGAGRCAGRGTRIVEAHRRAGGVAGRFWLDVDSGLVLRRESYDPAGARVRSSAFVDVQVLGVQVRGAAAVDDGDRGDQQWQVPEPDGWDPPRSLGALELVGGRGERHGRALVTHLSYADGLSTLSVFVQPGRLQGSPGPGFADERVDGAPVWVERGALERVVWSGGGRVFTVVSDADADTVRSAVAALPRDPAPAEGRLARLRRGLHRIGSWVDPTG